jgi:hypothetical protein
MNGEEVSRPESRYLERARALTQQAEALGGTLASWSATTLAFAWDNDSLEEAIELAGSAATSEAKWACAVARGELEPLAETGGGRADLAWGEALFAAVILARAARAGEVLVESSFTGLSAFVKTGKRVARDGDRRVHGLRIDARQPWKKDLIANVERLQTPPFVARADLRALLARPGLVHVVRADPGHGGTRMLAEIARAVAPGPCLLVSPAGASVEPLGALRRALVRILATVPYPSDPDLAQPLDLFLGGIGASIEQAASIVSTMLRPNGPADPPGALLLDDASEIDAESLEACAQVVAWTSTPFHVVVRIDATDQVPTPLASLPRGKEIELGPLERGVGETLAKDTMSGALGERSARRIARRAGYAPLGIVEAVAYGLTTGDIAWLGDRASLRTNASLAGKPAKAAYWIAKRAKATAPDERGVLATIALFGGEAMKETVKETLKLVQPEIDVDAEIKKLVARKWLVEAQRAWVALPSRTHRDTIAELLDELPRRSLHGAITDVLESSEGELACAEAAHHAVKAGEGERGARLALRAARAAAAVGMSKSANRLLTLARLADPKCEPLTRQALLTSLPPPVLPSSLPPNHNRAPMMPHAPSLARQAPAAPASSAFIDRNLAAPLPPPPASAPSPYSPPTPPTPPSLQRPIPVVPAPAPSRTAHDDAPTERISALNVAQAAGLLAQVDPDPEDGDRDSDYPTVIKLHPGLDRATEPDPIPAYEPPVAERPMPVVRPSREMAAVRTSEPSLPKPMAPLPMASGVPVRSSDPTIPRAMAPPPRAPPAGAPVVRRASMQGMPAVVPRAAPKLESPAPPAVSQAIAAPAPPVSAQISPPPSNGEAANAVATRMIDLAKSALVQGDAAAVDRWTEGLRAAGDHDRVAERIEAIARLSRGQVGEALRQLRVLRAGTDGGPASARAQASLALGVALAAADRADDALLAGLEALARAREGTDPRATGACLAFLSKLYGRVDRSSEAAALQMAAKR